MPCCPQNQKEGLRKPKSGNSKPPDGLQGVAMAKGKSMPRSHSNPGHAGQSHLLTHRFLLLTPTRVPTHSYSHLHTHPYTCPYTWQRGGQSNVRSWLRSWIRREAALRALRAPARGRTRRRSCLRIRRRAVCGRAASHGPPRWSIGGLLASLELQEPRVRACV